MKKTVLMTVILMTVILMSVSGAALAEQQTYSRYGDATNYAMQNQMNAQQAAGQQAQVYSHQPNSYMVYPGREQYGENFGPIPRHPGDYRDAVDRGTWSGGGDASRSFDIR
jgi:hypothetical protein